MNEFKFSAEAKVAIERPGRWAKQLVSHLGNKAKVEELDGFSKLTFGEEGTSVGLVSTDAENVLLTALGQTQEDLDRAKNVLGKHLERFAEKLEIKVDWTAK
jgi:hypothetical protein